MSAIYGMRGFEPVEPSGVVMMLTGIVMIGIYMWRNGLLQERLGLSTQKPAPTYEYCDYERRFTFSFSNLTSDRPAQLTLTA